MKTIDLATERADIEEVLRLAEGDSIVVRTAQGRVFAIADVTEGEEDEDDFSDEIALTRQNTALRTLLAERSKEPGKYTIDEVRDRLGLTTPVPGSDSD